MERNKELLPECPREGSAELGRRWRLKRGVSCAPVGAGKAMYQLHMAGSKGQFSICMIMAVSQRKVSRCIYKKARLVLLDEPTSALTR